MTPFYPVDIVIFDCDSTLTAIEGIDELARRAGVYDQLAPLTIAAMEGKIKLEEIYKRRLDLIKPSLADVEWLGQRYVEAKISDAGFVIDAIHQAGKQIHIVSGGIRQAVLIFAEHLNIPRHHVHAVDVRFTASDEYAGFDETSPLARSGGKSTVCRDITGDKHTAVMIGDGITDMEAAQDQIQFIGFGGVVRRQAVESVTPDYISGPTLKPLLRRLINRTV